MYENEQVTAKPYVRHNPDCPNKADITTQRGKRVVCNCPVWIYSYDGKTAKRFSAKTRTWAKAVEIAKRYQKDPNFTPEPTAVVKAEPQKSPDAIPIEKALEQWLKSCKGLSEGTLRSYTYFTAKVGRWARRNGIVNLNEVTPVMLDRWRGSWGDDAAHEDDRIGLSSQSTLLVRLKAFFGWAHGIELIAKNPVEKLKRIRPDYAETQVLTPEQFEELLAMTEPFCTNAGGDIKEYAKELRALFLLQRATGLRLIDCLMLPRSAVRGDRLHTRTQKRNAEVKRRLPKVVVDALADLSPDRTKFRSSHFLWGANVQQRTLSSRWAKIIQQMDAKFINEEGREFRFHSHCLRDTFAVELILAGMALEDVSKLLTHDSVLTTQRHYLPWVRRRETQLEGKLEKALSGMGLSFAA